MKSIKLFILPLFLLFSTISMASNDNIILKRIIHGDQQSSYEYQNGRTQYSCTYQKSGRSKILLSITKNGKKMVSIQRNGRSAPTIAIGGNQRFGTLDAKAVSKLPDDMKILLGYQNSHIKVSSMRFNMPGSGNGFGNNHLIILGWEIDFSKGIDKTCFYSKDCSCSGNAGSVKVSCACGTVVYCEVISVELCKYGPDGEPTSCKTITNCVGGCASP